MGPHHPGALTFLRPDQVAFENFSGQAVAVPPGLQRVNAPIQVLGRQLLCERHQRVKVCASDVKVTQLVN
jgi:hypothetical protein